MKTLLLSNKRAFFAKKINSLILILVLAAYIYGYFYLKDHVNILKLIVSFLSLDNYLPILVITITTNMTAYNIFARGNKITPQQRFTLGINRFIPTFVLIMLTLVFITLLFSLPLQLTWSIWKTKTLLVLLELIITSNLLIYAFFQNILGKFLFAIVIIIAKFFYTTKYGMFLYFGLCLISFLIVFATQDYFYLNVKKTSLAFIVKNKFIESVVYMLRETKTFTIYVLFILVNIYGLLPLKWHIHYYLGIFDIDSLLFFLFIFTIITVSIRAIIYEHKKDVYTQIYNPNIYVYFLTFNIIIFILFSTAANISVDLTNDLSHFKLSTSLLHAAQGVSAMGVFALISAIFRKNNSLVKIGALFAYIGLNIIGVFIKQEWLSIILCSSPMFIALGLEIYNAKLNKISI